MGILMHSYKEYVALMELHDHVETDKVLEVMKMFIGKIYQRPPLRSSVKRSLRVREIYDINVLEVEGRHILFKVKCESGTYVRKLCHDIGLVLGVGAHMRELRRTAVAHLTEDLKLVTMQDLSEALYVWNRYGDETLVRRYVLPMEYIVAYLPKVLIRDTAVDAIAHGAQLAVPGIAMLSNQIKKGSRVAVMTLKGELVAVGKALMDSEEIVKSEKGIAVEIERVVMDPNIYPKVWKKSKDSVQSQEIRQNQK
ncbi:MAG: RNA-guided pseudouridylation complex pseudouridine synthase subunit Cbf5 [Ignisphaera sp.]